MKTKVNILIAILSLFTVSFVNPGTRLHTNPLSGTSQAAIFGSYISNIDTITVEDEEFEKEMDRLRVELEKLKGIDIKIELEGIDEEMKNLAVELKKLNLGKLKIDIDSEEFRKNMHELAEELREEEFTLKDFDLNMSEFSEGMKTLKEEMKNLKIELKDLDEELEKLDVFTKGLKTEIKNDGLIDDEDKLINLELNKDEMKINGEKIPDELFQKYKRMYEEYFGKELSEKSHMHIH